MSEYSIDEQGVTFAAGTTWQESDHLNVRTESGTINYHAEAKCATDPAPVECSPTMISAAQNIGSGFIPWADLGIGPESCIEWVQFSRANYHYGESGEQPLCLTVPPVIPPIVPEPPVESIPHIDCPPNKVPGWLDEHGNPQGCVDNNPTPGAPKDDAQPELPEPMQDVQHEQIVQIPTEPAELAETGSTDAMIFAAIFAVAALAAGVAMIRKGVRHGRGNV